MLRRLPGRLARTTPTLALAALLCGALVAWAGEAKALPVLEKDDHTVNIDGSVKAFIYGMYFPFHPAEVRMAMGLGSVDYGGMGVGDLRIKLEGEHFDRWKWQVHFRTQPQISSFPGALGALSFAGGASPARSLPMQVVTPDGDRFTWRHELDRLMVTYRAGKVDIILGRQPISFGVGFVWKPADLVGTFSPAEIDAEYKPGVDALRVNLALGDFTELALVVAFGGPACRSGLLPSGGRCKEYQARLSEHHSVALARLRTNVGSFDLGVLAGWVRGDLVAGAFLSGTAGRFRVRSEVVFTWDLEEDGPDPNRTDWRGFDPASDRFWAGMGNPLHKDDRFLRAILGADYRFKTKKPLFLLAELYYNGFGRRHPSDYMARLLSPRVAEQGEVFNVGILYAALGLSWEPHPKLPMALTAMANLLDPSMLLTCTVTYKVGDESILVAGAMLPVGQAPALGDLTALADSNPTNDLRIRSELGLYPFIFYLQWKVYF